MTIRAHIHGEMSLTYLSTAHVAIGACQRALLAVDGVLIAMAI